MATSSCSSPLTISEGLTSNASVPKGTSSKCANWNKTESDLFISSQESHVGSGPKKMYAAPKIQLDRQWWSVAVEKSIEGLQDRRPGPLIDDGEKCYLTTMSEQ